MKGVFSIGFTRTIGLMFLVYVGYLLLGSLFFVMLETTQDIKTRNESIETIVLAKRVVYRLREANYSDDTIHNAFMEEKNRREHDMSTNISWKEMYGDKVFFAFILITTIGYGNVTPETNVGQVACIIYTLLGLPLHVIMMRLLSFKFRGALRKLFKIKQSIFPSSPFLLYFVGAIYFLVWMAVFILLPSYIFTLTEKWPYSQGVYFSFVSLSTVGLGDFVAGSRQIDDPTWYILEMIGMLIWMFFGLSFVAMALNMISYLMGIVMIHVEDCNCRKRVAAKQKMQPLLELINELNWQLVKCKPENFCEWKEIEEFKTVLTENPEAVDGVMLRKIFSIVIDLKEKCYDQLSGLHSVWLKSEIPMTPIIQKAHDNFPEIISDENSTVVKFKSSVQTFVVDLDKPVTNYRKPSDQSAPKDNLSASSHDNASEKQTLSSSDNQSPHLTRSDETKVLPSLSKDDDPRSSKDKEEKKSRLERKTDEKDATGAISSSEEAENINEKQESEDGLSSSKAGQDGTETDKKRI